MLSRFAPSPTGLLHVGNVRSAILNWAYVKKNNGKFILRIDDTDLQRSKKEYEIKIKENLNWLGLQWDKTFSQSSRQIIYEKKIKILKEEERLYPCFETEEELSLKKKTLLSSGKPPIYDRSALKLTSEQKNKNLQLGKKPHWRFKLEDKIIFWFDLIKGEVSFDSKNLSDPVLIREDGSLLYHLPTVIDDITENITDIIRGEDHISNTAYHIQIFEALNSPIPNFAHHPLIIDHEGRGLGKRMGSYSIDSLKEEGFENISLLNYLLNIGSSKDIIPEKNIQILVNNFDLQNISSSSPKFSKDILTNLNKDILQSYESKEVSYRLSSISHDLSKDKLWQFAKNNINFFSEIKNWIEVINSENNLIDKNIDFNFVNIAIRNFT